MNGSHTIGSLVALIFAWTFMVLLVIAISSPPTFAGGAAPSPSQFVYMSGACALLSIASRKG